MIIKYFPLERRVAGSIDHLNGYFDAYLIVWHRSIVPYGKERRLTSRTKIEEFDEVIKDVSSVTKSDDALLKVMRIQC